MTLSPHDVRDLTLHFAANYFQRSSMGPMLEYAELYFAPASTAEITARPTRELRAEPSHEPYDEEIELIGRVSRKLRTLRPKHRVALEAYYGDAGAACDGANVPNGHPLRRLGRLVALFPLVAAGREMIKRERTKTMVHVTGLQLLQNAVSRAEKSPEGSAQLAEVVAQITAKHGGVVDSKAELPPPRSVGEKIGRLREGAGLTQTELGALLGRVTPDEIHEWETSKVPVTRTLAARIAKVIRDFKAGRVIVKLPGWAAFLFSEDGKRLSFEKRLAVKRTFMTSGRTEDEIREVLQPILRAIPSAPLEAPAKSTKTKPAKKRTRKAA